MRDSFLSNDESEARRKLTNMAECEDFVSQHLKNTKIIVNVEEALEDLLVVSFTCGTTSFQGVLLNSTKKNWPCGIIPPSSFPGSQNEVKPHIAVAEQATPDSDKLFAVSRRYTYFQETDHKNSYTLIPRRANCKRFGDKNARTMRLRPRQVLCSKCKSICNENSENVEVQNTGKDIGRALDKKTIEGGVQSAAGQLKPGAKVMGSNSQNTLVANHCISSSSSINNNNNISFHMNSNNGSDNAQEGSGCDRMVLRKRRTNEDFQPNEDCSIKKVKEEEQEPATCVGMTEEKLPLAKSPFIKISFGPQGTVLKIPPRSHTYPASDTDGELQEVAPVVGNVLATKDASAKAAKKALKKAKKEAQKKLVPPYNNQHDLDFFDSHKSRHHKHKFKHKRRHKDNGMTTFNNNTISNFMGINSQRAAVPGCMLATLEDRPHDMENDTVCIEDWDCANLDGTARTDSYNEIKKECLRQKLSISLKRLSEKSYMKCGSTFNEDSNASGSSSQSDSNSNSEAGDVPEFPENEPPKDFEKVRPLMMRISSHNVETCTLNDGRTMSVGDIVWGKIHGFPWWPGKVLSITVSQRDNGMLITQQAHVAWFGSSTSSYMPCSQLVPFLECFKIRYNKKKRGPYKEAIKQATQAAQQVLHNVHQSVVDLET